MTDEEIAQEMRKPDGMVILSAADFDAMVTTLSNPTAGLRFVEGRLQQAFEIERWQSGKPRSRSIEWREVPSVSLADATKKDTP